MRPGPSRCISRESTLRTEQDIRYTIYCQLLIRTPIVYRVGAAKLSLTARPMYRSCRVLGPDIAGYVNVHPVDGEQPSVCLVPSCSPVLLSHTANSPVYTTQWQATDFVDEDWLNIKYPTKAPTATASITQPLYVMKSSLHTSAPISNSNATRKNLHDEE